MRGIVWGNTEQTAIIELEKIVEAYKKAGYSVAKITKLDCLFNNGDAWKACRCSEHERGRKCNISYIDVNIPKEKVDVIITPATIGLPYQATHYYYG